MIDLSECSPRVFWLPYDARLQIWGYLWYQKNLYTFWNLPGHELKVGIHHHGGPWSGPLVYRAQNRKEQRGWCEIPLDEVLPRVPQLSEAVIQEVVYHSLSLPST